MLSQTKVFPDGRNNLKVLQSMKLPHVTIVPIVAQALFLQGQSVQGSLSNISKQMLFNEKSKWHAEIDPL